MPIIEAIANNIKKQRISYKIVLIRCFARIFTALFCCNKQKLDKYKMLWYDWIKL